MRLLPFIAIALLSGCATVGNVQRARVDAVSDPADGLKRYYEERLTPAAAGYARQGQVYDAYQLPLFYDAQACAPCAEWARKGVGFRRVAWGSAGLLFAAGLGISAFADSNSPARSAWWMSALPAGLVGWTFHWVGDGWFTRPSVALYNKRLANQLGMQVAPFREEE